jgi:anti-anti-sigma regulatory factor
VLRHIGTLDSAHTQIVMESLIEEIVTSGAEIAIIDITGVPTVDTLGSAAGQGRPPTIVRRGGQLQ